MEQVKDYGHYFVTRDGRVFSDWSGKVKEIKQFFVLGYPSVNLRDEKSRPISARVHQMVAQAFIPNPENKPFVLHSDGNPKNNSFKNLRWGTAIENVADARGHGTLAIGERHGRSKLNKFQVFRMRLLRSITGMCDGKISKLFNVSQRTAQMIRRRVTWVHI